MIETFVGYEYEIFEYPDDDYPADKYYYYRIYDDSEQGYIESDGNMFEGAQEARFAAVGHILQLMTKWVSDDKRLHNSSGTIELQEEKKPERTTLEHVRVWVQHRIDYWENVVEKHPNDFETFTDIGETWRTGLERGEDKGMLDAFYMVLECINGQRR